MPLSKLCDIRTGIFILSYPIFHILSILELSRCKDSLMKIAVTVFNEFGSEKDVMSLHIGSENPDERERMVIFSFLK